METTLTNSIAKLSKTFVAPDKLVKSILKDELAFDIAMTIVSNAIRDGIITEQEVYFQITKITPVGQEVQIKGEDVCLS